MYTSTILLLRKQIFYPRPSIVVGRGGEEGEEGEEVPDVMTLRWGGRS